MSRVTKLAGLCLQKWSFFVKNSVFLDCVLVGVLGPLGSIQTGPGHFLGILASIFRIFNAPVVASDPWELGDLEDSWDSALEPLSPHPARPHTLSRHPGIPPQCTLEYPSSHGPEATTAALETRNILARVLSKCPGSIRTVPGGHSSRIRTQFKKRPYF